MKSQNHRPRILVVDDERAVTDILADLLEEEGYEVQRAYSGLQALQHLRADDPPDLVLTDVMMPEVSGTELVAHARHRLRMDHVPFMLLSAACEPRLGWDNVTFMAKPLHLDRLLQQVEQLLASRQDGRAA